jgi:hypothetical protein
VGDHGCPHWVDIERDGDGTRWKCDLRPAEHTTAADGRVIHHAQLPGIFAITGAGGTETLDGYSGGIGTGADDGMAYDFEVRWTSPPAG